MDFKTLAELFDSLPEEVYPPAPNRLYPIPFVANYILCLFNSKHEPFDIEDSVLNKLFQDEQYLDLEWSLLKRLMGKEKCKIYSTQRADGIRMLAIGRELVDCLLNDILDPLFTLSTSTTVVSVPQTKYKYSNANLIPPRKYDKLKAQLKRDWKS